MKGLCPRCDSETLALGKSKVEAANKKEIETVLRKCPKCELLFYESA
jgi:hypothetical protein